MRVAHLAFFCLVGAALGFRGAASKTVGAFHLPPKPLGACAYMTGCAPAWPAAGRKLLDEIKDEKERLGVHASLETLRPKLTSYGFSNSNDSWKSGFCRLDTPASFPSNSKATPGHGYKIRSIPQLVSYLERALGEASDAQAEAEATTAPLS